MLQGSRKVLYPKKFPVVENVTELNHIGYDRLVPLHSHGSWERLRIQHDTDHDKKINHIGPYKC